MRRALLIAEKNNWKLVPYAVDFKNTKELTIKFGENKNLFTDTEWKELYKLSEDTFVPESDSLKNSAAGAGLTDND